jgi:hypothetical protein
MNSGLSLMHHMRGGQYTPGAAGLLAVPDPSTVRKRLDHAPAEQQLQVECG